MNELQQEKARLEERIKFHDDQHQESARVANMYRRQLKNLERTLSAMGKSDGETLKEIAEGLK